jgi:hypothetical protein
MLLPGATVETTEDTGSDLEVSPTGWAFEKTLKHPDLPLKA